MSDLTPDSPEVQFCAIYCGLSKQHALESLSETKNQEWRHVAAEHNRLVADAVKAARIEALEEALVVLYDDIREQNCYELDTQRLEDSIRDLIETERKKS